MKTALVTGGTHGIGRKIVDYLQNDGYNVLTCARGNYESDIDFIKCDLTKQKDIDNLFNSVKEVDLLICNAGGSGGAGKWGENNWLDTDYSVWEEVYEKNVAYIIKLLRQYLPGMLERKWGRVVTISSNIGKESAVFPRPWYQMSKSSQISLMKAFSKNKYYLRSGVTFNTISAGAIMIEDTSWHKLYLNNRKEYDEFVDSLPMGRMGTPSDVANAVSFLCNEKSSFINGANLIVDGGQSFSF